jgi:hypothetical protein
MSWFRICCFHKFNVSYRYVQASAYAEDLLEGSAGGTFRFAGSVAVPGTLGLVSVAVNGELGLELPLEVGAVYKAESS